MATTSTGPSTPGGTIPSASWATAPPPGRPARPPTVCDPTPAARLQPPEGLGVSQRAISSALRSPRPGARTPGGRPQTVSWAMAPSRGTPAPPPVRTPPSSTRCGAVGLCSTCTAIAAGKDQSAAIAATPAAGGTPPCQQQGPPSTCEQVPTSTIPDDCSTEVTQALDNWINSLPARHTDRPHRGAVRPGRLLPGERDDLPPWAHRRDLQRQRCDLRAAVGDQHDRHRATDDDEPLLRGDQ